MRDPVRVLPQAASAGPMDAWVVATNKSFARRMGSTARGQPFGANVVLPKQLLLEAVKDW